MCVACGWEIPKSFSPSKPETAVEGQEQCLFLSVFTPSDAPTKQPTYPVLFHIHHGQMLYGFKVERGEVKNVVQKGIAVTNANYRLGAMGFLAHPELKEINV